METRIKIKKILDVISKKITFRKIEDLNEKIFNFLLRNKKKGKNVNYFYHLKTKKVYGLSSMDCKNIENFIYGLLVEKSNFNAFSVNIDNEHKFDLNNHNLPDFLNKLNKFLNIRPLVYQLYLAQFILNPTIDGYKLEFKVGRKICLLLYKQFNKTNLKKKIKITERLCNYIITEVFRKTPRLFYFNEYREDLFVDLQNVDEEILSLIIITYIYYNTFTPEIEIKNNIWVNTLKKNENYKLKMLENKTDLELLGILRSKMLNTLNIFAKLIGLECSNLFYECKVISQEKIFRNGKTINIYKINPQIRLHSFIVDKLPNLYLNKASNKVFRQIKFLKQDPNINDMMIQQIYNAMILHDSMEGYIFDHKMWFKSCGKNNLNLIVVNQVLKNFYDILESNSNDSLNENQINFIENLFDISLNAFRSNKILFKELLNYCMNFQNLINEDFENNKNLQIKYVYNKMKSQKYMLLTLFSHLDILTNFMYFEFEQKFDLRGRGYPNASILTYHHPIYKYFFNFREKNENIAILLKEEIAKIIMDNIRSLNVRPHIYDFVGEQYDQITNEKIIIPLISFNNETLNLFPIYTYFLDLLNLATKNWKFLNSYCVDARGSGVQIISMLLNDKALAAGCSLTSQNGQDIYSQFVDFFSKLNVSLPIFEHQIIRDDLFIELIMQISKFSQTELIDILNCKNVANVTTIMNLIDFNLLTKEFSYNKKNKTYIKSLNNLQNFRKNGFFLEQTKIRNELKYTQKYFIFVSLINLFIYNEDLDLYERFKNFVSRKLVKNAIMTTFYGSGTKTRCQSYCDIYIDIQTHNGILINAEDLVLFKKFAQKLDVILTIWIKKFYPNSLILIKKLNKACELKEFKPCVISSPHALWWYNPIEIDFYSKSLFNKDFKLLKYGDNLDYTKLGYGFIANYIQFCDATICSDIVRRLKIQRIPIKTTHDCFRTPYIYYRQLNTAIYESYIDFIKKDYLKLHFEKSNPFFYASIISAKKEMNIQDIEIEEIPKDASTIVKF